LKGLFLQGQVFEKPEKQVNLTTKKEIEK